MSRAGHHSTRTAQKVLDKEFLVLRGHDRNFGTIFQIQTQNLNLFGHIIDPLSANSDFL